MNPIPRKNSIPQVLSELQKNHLVAFVTDKWAGHRAIVVDFFGKPAATTSIPARLARKTGATLVPGYCVRTAPWHYKIFIKPEVLIDCDHEDWEHVVTRELNHELEHEIRRHPEQWLWARRRWKGSASAGGASGADTTAGRPDEDRTATHQGRLKRRRAL
jgi:KDO2-lipid IV(A) lauroyltransferase